MSYLTNLLQSDQHEMMKVKKKKKHNSFEKEHI